MYFLFDILFERADQKETCDLQLVYINSIFLYSPGSSSLRDVFAAEVKQILTTVLTLIWK